MALTSASFSKNQQVQRALQVIHLLLVLILLQSHTSNQVQEVKFDEKTGLFLVHYNNKFHSVCYHGDPNTWGKREAIVTCRQLGYIGGWPVQIQQSDNSYPHLYNFDCDGTEFDIKSCSFELATSCRDSKLAGIQCYRKFDIRIVDGPVESVGNVEVQYDSTWSAVCYVSIASETRTWTFQNAQIVCRELGYPGTMITRRGRLANGKQIYSVDGFKCREDLRDESLSECLPDIPQERENVPSCGLNNEAVVICAGPGYVGCYNTDGLDMVLTLPELQNATTQLCRHICRKNNFTHAYLFSGNMCSCGNKPSRVSISDIRCRETCTGNNNQVCGGVATASVYDVEIGICTHTQFPSEVYYHGDVIGLPCGPEMKPGVIQLQCLRNYSTSSNDLAWSEIMSNCSPTEPAMLTGTYLLPNSKSSETIVSTLFPPNVGEGEQVVTSFPPHVETGNKQHGALLSIIVFFLAICVGFTVPIIAYVRFLKMNKLTLSFNFPTKRFQVRRNDWQNVEDDIPKESTEGKSKPEIEKLLHTSTREEDKQKSDESIGPTTPDKKHVKEELNEAIRALEPDVSILEHEPDSDNVSIRSLYGTPPESLEAINESVSDNNPVPEDNEDINKVKSNSSKPVDECPTLSWYTD